MRTHGGISSFTVWQGRQDHAESARVSSGEAQSALPQSPVAGALPHLQSFPGFRHFDKRPEDRDRFKFRGQLFDPSNPSVWQDADAVITKLAHWIVDGGVLKPEDEFNFDVPSGYTYFLQLVAHDLVHSSLFLSRSGGQMFGLTNARNMPLRLETVYGGGPIECPQAYRSNGIGFRNRLRLGRTSTIRGEDRVDCPMVRRDIARATTKETNVFGYPEPLIADPRNDSHAIISQLVVLFHYFHNALADRLEQDASLTQTGDAIADAQRLFVAAQSACVLVYRHLVRHDLLEKLLDPAVHAAYNSDSISIINKPHPRSRTEWRAPVEFTHGFFAPRTP